MEPSELLRFVVSLLERLGVRYFVTGSTASIFFGEPRFTNDIDVVVIAGILKISRDILDFDYIESWADHLGLETLWRTILRKSIQDGLPPDSDSP